MGTTSAAIQTLIASPQDAAADVAPCFTPGGSVNTNQVNFTLTTSSRSNVVPEEFWGRWVRITPHGSTLYFNFSFVTLTVTAPLTATDAGARDNVSAEGPFTDGYIFTCRVPHPGTGGSVFFNRIGGTASQSVQMVLADGTVGATVI